MSPLELMQSLAALESRPRRQAD